MSKSLPSTIQLVIFDMDGTLVQSEESASQALKDVIPAMTDSVAEVTRRYKGMRLAEIFNDIERRFPQSIPDNCLDLYRDREETLSGSHIFPSDGANELLTELRTQKCIATNAPVEKSERSLSIAGLSHHFTNNVFSAYLVNAWKPDPALFLHAAKYYGIEPSHCLVVEDSDVGIQAGLSANMSVVHYDPAASGSTFSVPSIGSLVDLLKYVK